MFAALADVDDDGVDRGEQKKPKVQKKAGEEKKGPKMTAEQLQLLNEAREKKAKKKAEKKAQQEAEKQCYFFSECGRQKDGDWPYCDECYTTRLGDCEHPGCKESTRLTSSDPGTHHPLCDAHRKGPT